MSARGQGSRRCWRGRRNGREDTRPRLTHIERGAWYGRRRSGHLGAPRPRTGGRGAAAGGSWRAGAEQTAEEARWLCRLLRVSELLFQIGDPLLRGVQTEVLDQHRLDEIVGHVGLLAQRLPNERIGFGVLGLTAGTFQAR